MPDGDGLEFSRRTFLAAAAATGTIISGGGKTVAEFSDAENFGAQLGAGELDLEVSWQGSGSEVFLGVVSEVGDGDTRDIELELTEDSNPAWVWFSTGCPSCLPIEELIEVTFELDTGSGPETIFEGTLREARATLGPWIQLDEGLEPGETWILTVTWELTESVESEQTINFDFDFQVTQQRHLVDPESEKPTRECAECPDDGNGGTHEISWLAFGAESTADDGAITFSPTADGTALEYDLNGQPVDVIALKYATHLDLFSDVAESGTLSTGDGDVTLDQNGSEYPEDPPLTEPRTNQDPFPEHCWMAKYNVGESSPDQTKAECDQ